MTIYINKKESKAIADAFEEVNNILEGCTADEETEEGKRTINYYNRIIKGLRSLDSKLKK